MPAGKAKKAAKKVGGGTKVICLGCAGGTHEHCINRRPLTAYHVCECGCEAELLGAEAVDPPEWDLALVADHLGTTASDMDQWDATVCRRLLDVGIAPAVVAAFLPHARRWEAVTRGRGAMAIVHGGTCVDAKVFFWRLLSEVNVDELLGEGFVVTLVGLGDV